MAELILDPHSEYKTRGPVETGSTNQEGEWVKPWSSQWSNYTTQDTEDDDMNAFYCAHTGWHESSGIEGTYDWSCRLSFTIPNNFNATRINKLVVKMKPRSNSGKIKYPLLVLSSANYGPNP